MLNSILPVEQKRMKIVIVSMLVNFSIFLLAMLLHDSRSFADLGAGLALVNTPIMTWVVGESIRPTGAQNIKTEITSVSKDKDTTTKVITNE
jgi:predicted membrane protein